MPWAAISYYIAATEGTRSYTLLHILISFCEAAQAGLEPATRRLTAGYSTS